MGWFESTGWFAIYAPTGTPTSVVERINRDINKIVMEPEMVARFAELGNSPKTGTRKQLGDFVGDQRTIWKKTVANVELQLR